MNHTVIAQYEGLRIEQLVTHGEFEIDTHVSTYSNIWGVTVPQRRGRSNSPVAANHAGRMRIGATGRARR